MPKHKRNHIDELVDAIHQRAEREATPTDVIPLGHAVAQRPDYAGAQADAVGASPNMDVTDVIMPHHRPRGPHGAPMSPREKLAMKIHDIVSPADRVFSDDEWLHQGAPPDQRPNPFKQMLADAEAGPTNTTLPPMKFAAGQPDNVTLPPTKFDVGRPQLTAAPLKFGPSDMHADELDQLDDATKARMGLQASGRR